MDFQYGSTGKGLIAGYLARRENYDTVVCSFATNAGHSYFDRDRGLEMMTQQLPTGISSPTVKKVFLGPGSLIHAKTLQNELTTYCDLMEGKQLFIHPHAAVVEDYHRDLEIEWGMTKMGSTAKGVGAAMIERVRRVPQQRLGSLGLNVACVRFANGPLAKYVVTSEEYQHKMQSTESVLIEGAQGFSLSMYHGFYPYTTSRDVTPWQIAADCGVPFKWAPYIQVYGAARTYPIRVNNRDGSSGPGYDDQREMSWDEIGVKPELTTVTKLPRRIFTFSHKQIHDAVWHCGGYWKTNIFLNFCNYMKSNADIKALIDRIQAPHANVLNAPQVTHLGFGPDDSDIMTYDDYLEHLEHLNER
jgi:adenylosuccinate synthase